MQISSTELQRSGIWPESLKSRYQNIRRLSDRLCAPLETEDFGVQPMPEASPPKWHLAHTSWFFETFVLKHWQKDYRPFHPQYEYLFNSYYNGIGKPFERARRGTLSLPTVAEIFQYRHYVDEHLLSFLDDASAEACERIALGLQHEQQHQELLLTDIKYNFGCNPLLPAYLSSDRHDDLSVAFDAPALTDMQTFAGGLFDIGAQSADFCFDNELPVHKFHLQPYAFATRLVSNADYQAFVDDGGYQQPQLWLSDGWSWLQSNPDIRAPLYWIQKDDQWMEYTLGGAAPLQPKAPVCHVSFFEADAFARWCGMRLPLEEEWEVAAGDQIAGNFLESGKLHPEPSNAAPGLQQMYGDVWEWTQSAYLPYPGYQPAGGAIGEYNGKFMNGQRVLRGGSCVTSQDHIRASYRNFFYPQDRWQFTGIRLAQHLPA